MAYCGQSQVPQTANGVFAGPATGGPAIPTFRALVSSDIPAGFVQGSGTSTKIPIWNGTSSLTDSAITIAGGTMAIANSVTTVDIQATTPTFGLGSGALLVGGGVSVGGKVISGAGFSTTSDQTTSFEGTALYLVGSFNQNGALIGNSNYNAVYISRTLTLGAYDATGAVFKIEDTTAATGNLIEVVRSGTMMSLSTTGTLTAIAFSGSGASLTSLNANNISSGTLAVARGGTNSGTALNGNRIMVSNTTPAIVEAAAMTNGQLLIGSTGAAPVVANLTQGAGVTITNGAGSITIAATGTASNIMYWGVDGQVGKDVTRYAPPGMGAVYLTADDIRVPIPRAGTVKNLYIRARVAPDTNRTCTVTVFKNGVATALTCSISGATTTASDITNSFTVVASDLLSVRVVTSGTAVNDKTEDLMIAVEVS